MNRIPAVVLGLFLFGLGDAGFVAAVSGQAAGAWTTLFDGKNLDHWFQTNPGQWSLSATVPGTVESTKGGGRLVTKQSYGDFELRAEFWVSADANSGVYFRIQDPKNIGTESSYEIQINDMRPDPTYGTGALLPDVSPVRTKVTTGNRWSTIELSVKGPRIIARINDIQTVDAQDTKFTRPGPIAIQGAQGTVRIRKVEVRPI